MPNGGHKLRSLEASREKTAHPWPSDKSGTGAASNQSGREGASNGAGGGPDPGQDRLSVASAYFYRAVPSVAQGGLPQTRRVSYRHKPIIYLEV